MIGQIPQVGKETIAADLQTMLALSKVKLFSNNTLVSINTVKTDLVEATFTGYVAQTATTVDPPVIDPINGGISVTFPSHLFKTTDPTTVGETIYGFWVELASGALILAGNFDQPMQMNEPFQGIPLQITLNF